MSYFDEFDQEQKLKSTRVQAVSLKELENQHSETRDPSLIAADFFAAEINAKLRRSYSTLKSQGINGISDHINSLTPGLLSYVLKDVIAYLKDMFKTDYICDYNTLTNTFTLKWRVKTAAAPIMLVPHASLFQPIPARTK